MHRLHELFQTFAAYSNAAYKVDTILETIGAVEAAIPTPDISRARAEHALHRLMADMLLTKRAYRVLH